MKNREVPRAGAGSEPVGCSRRSPADFRVVARLRGGALALVSLAETRQQAVAIAERFRDEVCRLRRRSPNRNGAPRLRRSRARGQGSQGRRQTQAPLPPAFRVAVVLVQVWEERWRQLSPRHGGFVQVFPARENESRSEIHSGSVVRCHLLEQKTRKEGWRARLTGHRLAGPVTNSADVPGTARAGQAVLLQIGTISADRRRIQFHWLANADGEAKTAS